VKQWVCPRCGQDDEACGCPINPCDMCGDESLEITGDWSRCHEHIIQPGCAGWCPPLPASQEKP